MSWHATKAIAAARRGAVRGIKQWGDDVLKASQPEVPVSQNIGGGFLKGTGTVTMDNTAMQATVSYAGPGDKPDLPIWVHENRAVAHPTGKAKFLEDPVNASKTSGPQTVADAIKGELG